MDMEVMRKSHVKSMRLRWDYKPVSIDADIEQLDNHILNQNFVPVVDGRNVFIGIITRKEIIKELLKQKKDVLAKSSLAEQKNIIQLSLALGMVPCSLRCVRNGNQS